MKTRSQTGRSIPVRAARGAAGILLLAWVIQAADAPLYTACNIWHEESDEIDVLNCKTGDMIPAGTPVEIVKTSGKAVVFKTNPDGRKYTLRTESRYFQNMSSKDIAALYFTPKTLEEQTAGLTPREIDLIRRGQIEGGMSKRAILISYGRPAPHKTPSLDNTTWYYWGRDSRDQMELKLGPDGRLIGDKSLAAVLDTQWNYTACNIWFDDPDEISSVNYQVGKMIPAGTRVSKVKLSRDEISFDAAGFKGSFVMNDFRHQQELDIKTVASRFFTSKPFEELTAGLPAGEVAAIRKGQTIPGMSKQAVLIAFGYPPPHRTSSLDLNTWNYWAKSQFSVNFDRNGRVAEKPAAPAETLVAKTEPPARMETKPDPPSPPPVPPRQKPATPPPVQPIQPIQPVQPPPAPQPVRPAEPTPAVTEPTITAADGKAWAVIVGIADYKFAGKGALSNLSFADDDAKAFAGALRNQGWPSSHIRLLVNEEATLRNVTVALESWLTKATAKDMIVLFWSGHGFPDPEDQEKVYFACYDTDITIPATGYRMDRVHETLAERRAKNVVVFADTCHAGKLMTRNTKGISIVSPIERMRREQTTPKGWVFMVSAEADRLAIEHSSWSNGAFSHCLMQGLGGKADGYQSSGERDGRVTMQELRTYMETMMPEETQRVLGTARHPIITTSSGDPKIWDLTLRQ